MWIKNLKVLAVALAVLAFYTGIAHIIPQLASEVPEVLDLNAASPEMMVEAGEKLYNGAGGCTACHGMGTRAPNLLADEKGEGMVGARCGKREPGKDCKTYLLEALTEPNEYVVKGYGPIMPDMRRTLDMGQIWVLVAFLESQGGEVTVTADDIQSTASPEAGGGDDGGGETASATTDPQELLNEKGCLGCHKLGAEGPAVGPALNGMGGRLSRDGIREGIIDPDAKVAAGFENFKGMMPKNFGDQLSAKQLEILVNFLASQK